MSYIRKTLSINEKITQEFPIHWMSYVVPAILFAISLSVIAIPIWFSSFAPTGLFLLSLMTIGLPIWCLVDIIGIKMMEQAITNKRALKKTGIISTKADEIKLDKIESVEIKQGIIGRILGYGDITIRSANLTNSVKFKSIDNPFLIKRDIENLIEE